MNRRQKIIVTITGIFIVLLALVGLTYAYFLTRITGNENEKSISVTTANLELVYGDNSEEIIRGTGALIPTIETEAKDAIGTKTFTVTNNGNDSSYVVIIDNVETKYASNGSYKDENGNTVTYTKDQETNFVTNDFKYTLTCKVKDKNGNVKTDEKCIEVNSLSIFPIDGGILVGNAIPENRVHEYTLTLWYIDNGENQSNDMNKTYQARVNIEDVNQMENPFSTGVEATDKASLAYNIINNAKTNKNGTIFVNTPLTSPANAISGVTSYKTVGEEATYTKSMSSVSSYANNTWYYYDKYVVDSTTGKITLSGKHSCTYNSKTTNTDGETVNCYDDMINKYLYNNYASNNTNANNHTEATKNNLSTVYKVTSATVSTINYVAIYNSPNEAERVLVPTSDDYGTSYYYRGDVEDNYVNFAGMCWRIVRIEGDGSVKLILEDAYAECNDNETEVTSAVYTGNWSDGNAYVFGYDDSTGSYRLNFLNYTGGLADSFKSFQTSLAKKIDTNLIESSPQTEINTALSSKLKIDEWCYDDKVTATGSGGYEHYGAYTRIKTNKKPSLKCSGTKLTKFKDGTDMYVATLTADEIVFAGADGNNTTNFNFYLVNNYSRITSGGLIFWTLSPYYFNSYNVGHDYVFPLLYYGHFTFYSVDGDYNASSRPAVTLKPGSIIIEGQGTIEKPYVIE